jgi:4'-phosphopantetheinyl transferase
MIVDIWTIEPDPREDLAALATCLAPDELVRADRLRVQEKRESFIYHRALLRRILASYLGTFPGDVPLVASSQGKPLLGKHGGSPLAFNLSHCRKLALLAVASGATIGIDVESLHNHANYDALAAQALSAAEFAGYQQLPLDRRPAAILRAWTRKEAYLKAVGCGIARPLCDIQVTFLEGEPPRLLVSGDPHDPPANWMLRSWSPRPGWFAAVAVPRDGSELQLEWKSAASLRDRIASPQDRAALTAASK